MKLGRSRPVIRFSALALTYFALFMLISPLGFYPPLFRAGANALFHSMGSGRIAKFEPFDDPDGVFDTRMSVGTDAPGVAVYPGGTGVNAVRQGYTPSALLVALVLATPIVWWRRWRALGVGLLLIQGFVALRVGVTLLYGFTRVGMDASHLLEVRPLVGRLLRRADQIVAGDLHLTFVAPILIWILVAVRPDELGTLWRRGDPPGRNARCPCGSGLKYKHCCLR